MTLIFGSSNKASSTVGRCLPCWWIVALLFVITMAIGVFLQSNNAIISKQHIYNIVQLHKPRRFGKLSIDLGSCCKFKYESSSVPGTDLGGCGVWQNAYKNLHHGILHGKLPPRYLVSVAVEAGFADRIIGIITEFYFALLTNRAFQITTYGTMPRFQAALNEPNIKWYRPTDPPELTDNLKFTYRGQRGYGGNRSYGPEVDTKLYWPMYLVNDGAANAFFSSANVSTFPEGHTDVQTVFISSNRGRVVELFNNPYHCSQLFHMGLRPETAIPCAWNFLFSVNEIVQKAMATEFAALSSPSVLKISINIRVGDHVFDPNLDKHTTLQPYRSFFTCAETIESFARIPNQRVIWYVTSDSLRLRQLAKERFREKVLTQDTMTYVHGDCGDIAAKRHGGCSNNSQDLSIQMAVGQVQAMSMCDYHIIWPNSGFGRFAAALSGRWYNVFTIQGISSTCGKNNNTRLETLATIGAGL